MERNQPAAMVWCEKGIQILLATVGAFASFGLMTVAIGTDYWLYARAFICNSTANHTHDDPHNKDRKDPGALTHSGLWRICCLEGLKRGVCSQINHFPEDADYDHDGAEYVLRVVRASSFFPILSAILLLMGGVCIAVSRFYKNKGNIVLGAGILFVAAGLSNIIGVIVYISAALGDISPKKDEDKKVALLLRLVLLLRRPVLHPGGDAPAPPTPPIPGDHSPVGGGGKAFSLTPSALLSQATVGAYSVSTLPKPPLPLSLHTGRGYIPVHPLAGSQTRRAGDHGGAAHGMGQWTGPLFTSSIIVFRKRGAGGGGAHDWHLALFVQIQQPLTGPEFL
ncbi:hypothetical protein SKAU_G00226170 [Synaphobranchus kaupii]|uniref:Voltage-dependent calcium channel gamma-8 subunit n=1 Tax=Synaphobranchus kaupii TaxID=118154 RepID=A0A9Q1IUB2_SYNKA|nr:hypothetical protein SKAU_G00226170 [Synaphobranchus kaupii]